MTSVSAVTGSDIFPLFKKFCGEDLLCCSCHLGILSIVLICYALLLLKSLRKLQLCFCLHFVSALVSTFCLVLQGYMFPSMILEYYIQFGLLVLPYFGHTSCMEVSVHITLMETCLLQMNPLV